MSKEFEKATAYLALCAVEEMYSVGVLKNEEIAEMINKYKNIATDDLDGIIPEFKDNKEAVDYFIGLTKELLKSLSELEENND